MTTATRKTRTARSSRTAKNAEPVVLARAVSERVRAAMAEGRIPRPRSYQGQRLASQSRFNLDLWCRQSGKSLTNAMDAVLLAEETGESVMCLSASLDLTRELMMKVAMYAEVVSDVAGEIQREVAGGGLDETLYVDEQGVRVTQTVITLPSGQRIVGRPANPRTARGFSMHVKLDEFGMHRDPDEIWAAAFPSITSRKHLRLDVMSTPGIRSDDKFADLCKAAAAGDSDFAFTKVTIHDAIAAGLDADAESLRKNLRDQDRWRREYLCEFVDEAGALLTLELIRGCEHEGLRCELPGMDARQWDAKSLGWEPGEGELFLGVDIGRRHDLTVFWLLQMLGDVAWTRAVLELRGTPFSEQAAVGDCLFQGLPIRRACIDATGLGMQLAEGWQQKFGTSKVEAVTFTPAVKAALAEPLRGRFQDRLLRIPIGAEIRDDLHSIRRTSTAAGNVRYLAERTEDGHADRFWALALANHAAEKPTAVGAQWL